MNPRHTFYPHADFSFALDRGTYQEYLNSTYTPGLGKIAFGGIAPVPVLPISVTTPMLAFQYIGRSGYLFYIAHIDKYTFPGSEKLNTSSNNTILDSGTTINLIPSDAMAAYAAAFVPPAYVDNDIGGYYVVPCTAKVPPFEVVIGGVIFPIAAADQVLPSGVTDASGTEICILGTQVRGLDIPAW